LKHHLLLEKAFVYPLPKEKPHLEECCTYDLTGGYWLIDNSKNPLVFDNSFVKPRSKKEDVETGEDQKGE